MSGPDRSWTITPTIVWFVATLVVALLVFDGGVGALADRLTHKRTTAAEPSGPVFAPKHPEGDVVIAEADTKHPAPPPPPPTRTAFKTGFLDDTCIDGTTDACRRWAMDAFYEAVEAERANKLDRPVRVSWYGDSVIGTDAIPGRLRTKLQHELGDGGPGFVFIVPPHRFCGHEAITRFASSDWTAHSISSNPISDGYYGVGGSTAIANDGRATIKISSGTAKRASLHFLAQPKGGHVAVTADGNALVDVETAGDTTASRTTDAKITTGDGAKVFKLEATGRVRLFGLDLENDRGAVVDNFGIVSVNVKTLANLALKPEAFADALNNRGADLLMIMIGANEAQWLGPHDQDTKDYQGNYEKILAPIRKARPNATCLVVSPTDQAMAVDDGYQSRPVMPVLVEAQRKAAVAQGCAFYSTYKWMGGRGSASDWFRRQLVGSDFQHLSRAGANLLADAVFDALMSGVKQHGTK